MLLGCGPVSTLRCVYPLTVSVCACVCLHRIYPGSFVFWKIIKKERKGFQKKKKKRGCDQHSSLLLVLVIWFIHCFANIGHVIQSVILFSNQSVLSVSQSSTEPNARPLQATAIIKPPFSFAVPEIRNPRIRPETSAFQVDDAVAAAGSQPVGRATRKKSMIGFARFCMCRFRGNWESNAWLD